MMLGQLNVLGRKKHSSDNAPSPFCQGAGVRYRCGRCCTGETTISVTTGFQSELLLSSCLSAFVTGIVLAAATFLSNS
jgi:hypothetical protein